MQVSSCNWSLWAGALLSASAFLSYFFVFVWFPVTRDTPWANLLLFGMAAVLVGIGVRRAFAPERPRRAKITACILAALSVAMLGGFVFSTGIMARRLPPRTARPRLARKRRTCASPIRMARLSRSRRS